MKKRSNTALVNMGQELQRGLGHRYPDLTVSCRDKDIVICGTFPLLHEDKVLDRYQIEIIWAESDTTVPLLRETGGRIPWILDRHMTQSGLACLFVPEEWLLREREERTLIHYLDRPVRDYFLWQSLVESGEAVPWPDRPHGVEGLLESYGDMLGLRNPAAVKLSLDYLSRETIKGHWMCPCGSGRRNRDCHIDRLRELKRRIPRHIAKLAIKRLQKPVVN